MSLRLHKTKGVNPHMMMCQRCGKETGEIALLGFKNTLWKCHCCQASVVAGKCAPRICPKCNGECSFTLERELEDYDKIAGGLCKECNDKESQCIEEVKKGGVLWRCTHCHSEGALKAESEVAKNIRQKINMTNGEIFGIELTEEQCPVCQEKKQEVQ